jgi:hypothetical protein
VVKAGKGELEKEFLMHFDEIYNLCKNKEIKMFACIGDPEARDLDREKVEKERRAFEAQRMNEIREEGVQRYEKVLDSDLPIYEPVLPYYESTWDSNKNNANKLRKMRLKKFMKVATKVVLRIRAEKRLSR